MVNLGLRLEEGVREGRLKEGGSTDSSRKYGSGLPKKKEHSDNAISQGKPMRLPRKSQRHQHMASVTSVINSAPVVQKNLIQIRTSSAIPKELLWWLMQSGILSFEDSSPNVQANLFPKQCGAIVNMVEGCPGKYQTFDVNLIRKYLVEMHANLCELSYYEHDHASCHICSKDPQECVVLKKDLQEMLDQNLIQVTRDRNEDDHEFDKVIPYKYNVAMVENGKEVHIPSFSYVVNIVDNADQGEVLKLIKKSDFNVVDQLLHTPSKISVLSLLMSLKAHREALQKVLEKAYVDHDEDAMSNMLVDTSSSLNVLPKDTLSKLSYQGSLMRFSGVIVKAIDGSRKTVIGEVDLPIKIGPCLFQITFQVIDIHPAYSCLLGRLWIHKAGEVTLTLHQKLKFINNGKLVIMGGEQAMLVSHLSLFSYIDVDEVEGTSFQALPIDNIAAKKNEESMSSLKDTQHVLKNCQSTKWGRVVELAKNKNRAGLGFSPGSTQIDLK
ncbi:uncharacterized protein LOC127094889 [Lathyrus oleraceus]|uniref:uncharacterized protein LOC127094889 n=1 Tax=Pisum sativum TaxID=3888 RepID=UPI0021CFF1CE|nr:uncharacterized protein LOC127094889 [Pisum sativum]